MLDEKHVQTGNCIKNGFEKGFCEVIDVFLLSLCCWVFEFVLSANHLYDG